MRAVDADHRSHRPVLLDGDALHAGAERVTRASALLDDLVLQQADQSHILGDGAAIALDAPQQAVLAGPTDGRAQCTGVDDDAFAAGDVYGARRSGCG